MSAQNEEMCVVTEKRTTKDYEPSSIWWKVGLWTVAVITIIAIFMTILISLLPEYKSPAADQPLFGGVCEIDKKNVYIGEKIGEGQFGIVYKGRLNDQNVAVKSLKNDPVSGYPSKSQMEEFMSEINIMRSIGIHKNVVKFLGCCTRVGPPFIILEHASKGDLKSFLERSESSQMELTSYATQVAHGMAYIHTKNVIHRDLAARNVLVDDQNKIKIKISDFGLSRNLREKTYYRPEQKKLIPFNWTAPEAIIEGTFSMKSDVWSYGVLLWEIFTHGHNPYHIGRVQLQAGERLNRPLGCNDTIYHIMHQCWSYNPDDRPEFTEIIPQLRVAIDEEVNRESHV